MRIFIRGIVFHVNEDYTSVLIQSNNVLCIQLSNAVLARLAIATEAF